MKHILVLSAFLIFAAPAEAQDPIPYDQMSYEELQQVEQTQLSKTDKKAWKKAYRKAEKAFKKAEKTRQKVEKKRAKAEAKRNAKVRKAVNRQLSAINSSYAKASIYKDDFEANLRIRGKQNSQSDWDTISVLGTGGQIRYFLRSFYNPAQNELLTQAYVTVQFQRVVDQAHLDKSGLSPARYARRKGWFYGYSRAALRGGKVAPFNVISHNAPTCAYYCKFNEEYAVTLNLPDILRAIEAETNLDIKISANNAPSLILTIPYYYMVGYILKLADTDSRLSDLRTTAQVKINAIKAKLPATKTSE